MDNTFNIMDTLLISPGAANPRGFVLHLTPLRRNFPHSCQVNAIGYLPAKTSAIDQTFDTMNFSLILAGEGEYEFRGRRWQVLAPCVITQWPGEPVRYQPYAQWEELYLIYPPQTVAEWRRRRLATPDGPVWYMQNAVSMREAMSEMQDICSDLSSAGAADRLDRLCERMVLESRLSETNPALDRHERVIRSIRAQLERDVCSDHDVDSLARRAGLSPATFRRHWARLVGTPPRQYVLQLRMQRACRMLVETDMQVAEIARDLNFRDPLYFSRRFRATVGETATDYRRTHRLPGR